MRIARYLNGHIVDFWHDRDCAERNLGEGADIRELPDDHHDILAKIAADAAERDAVAQDKSTLRQQIIGATEAQWLGLTEVQRQKIILKALKYVARNL